MTEHSLRTMIAERPSARHKKSLSLFWPSGPITAKHTKNREWLLPAKTTNEQLVWKKSGPPTHEPRMQRGAMAPPLLHTHSAASTAGRAVVNLRRDMNEMVLNKNFRDERPASLFTAREQQRHLELDDLCDDELWDSLAHPFHISRAEIKERAIARLVKHRELDAEVPGNRRPMTPPTPERTFRGSL